MHIYSLNANIYTQDFPVFVVSWSGGTRISCNVLFFLLKIIASLENDRFEVYNCPKVVFSG